MMNDNSNPKSWLIFEGKPKAKKKIDDEDGIKRLPPPPSWRKFDENRKGITYQARGEDKKLVNAALYLRRPLLVTGKPGTGKTSLAYAVAEELDLGKVLRWNITTRSTLKEGLYDYDAIGRLQDVEVNRSNQPNLEREKAEKKITKIGNYITLGALGTAFLPSEYPRVLLIDEIDKSDIDLPNDLLNIFEEGRFEIPELTRIAENYSNIEVKTADGKEETIPKGIIQCTAFPFVVMTSNDEREFPPPFLRRCIRLELSQPTREELEEIIQAHFENEPEILQEIESIIKKFLEKRKQGELATDQLLNAIYLAKGNKLQEDKDTLIEKLLRFLEN